MLDVVDQQRPMSERSERSSNDSVAVVITSYNHARFLAEAIDSVLIQTSSAAEIVVVDDGSTDGPDAVVARYPSVRLVHRENGGLAAARNTGIAATRSPYLVFLDADDRLLPGALAAGVKAHRSNPGCGLVYGGFRHVDINWQAISPDRFTPPGADPLAALLRDSILHMHATVMYRRGLLAAVGNFDETLRLCEDFDVYFRLVRHAPIADYPQVVAEYRWHGSNISSNPVGMAAAKLAVLDRYRPDDGAVLSAAYREGRRTITNYYAERAAIAARRAIENGGSVRALSLLAWSMSAAPAITTRGVVRAIYRRMMPAALRRRIWRLRSGGRPVGTVDMGDFDTTEPLDMEFGWGRGLPVDRHYVESFLAAHAGDIRGHTLEIGDDRYTRSYGGDRVRRFDVLHVNPESAAATLIGDIAVPGTLPPNTFDCAVVTQTLHLIYDMRAAVAELYHGLAPDGVALVTVPGISQLDRAEWASTWYWAITQFGAARLFNEVFGPENVTVEVQGNVYAATAFLQGLAVSEVDKAKLAVVDPAYPVIVTVRAVKRAR